MTKYSFIGSEAPRPDAPDKVAGKALYIHDLVRPGMLYGKIKFSEYAHARIKHIDTSRAEKLQGVRAVITAYNTPEIRIGFIRDNFALKKDKVRQYRDEVAAVAAIDPEIAEEAMDLIKVEYELLPAVVDVREAMSAESPLLHDTMKTSSADGESEESSNIARKFRHTKGDLEKGFAESDVIVERDFRSAPVHQSYLEP